MVNLAASIALENLLHGIYVLRINSSLLRNRWSEKRASGFGISDINELLKLH